MLENINSPDFSSLVCYLVIIDFARCMRRLCGLIRYLNNIESDYGVGLQQLKANVKKLIKQNESNGSISREWHNPQDSRTSK